MVGKPVNELQAITMFDENKAITNPDFSPLQYINVDMESVSHWVLGLYDSGAETCLANSSIINQDGENVTYVGQIKIKPIIGPAIDADLIKLNIRLANNEMQYISVHCAVSPEVNDDLVLTADVVQRLARAKDRHVNTNLVQCVQTDYNDSREHLSNPNVIDGNDNNFLSVNATFFVIDASEQMAIDTSTSQNVPDCNVTDRSDFVNSDTFRQEQRDDKHLTNCWRQARQNKGNFLS
jgi:hypothetical protein